MFSRFFRALAPSLRGRLSLVLAAVLFLGATLAGGLIWQGYRNEREVRERHLVDATRAIATLMEAELSKREALLKGLSVSVHLRSESLEAFAQQAKQVAPGTDEWIILFDITGRQLVNTRADPGTVLPTVKKPADIGKAMAGGATYISNLEDGPLAGGKTLAVVIPVLREGKLPQVLCFAMKPEHFTETLLSHRIGEGWLVSVIDRNMNIAGRSRNPEMYVGKKASDRMIKLVAAQNEGVFETTTLDGVPSTTAFHRSSRSGWTVIVAVPRTELFASAQQLVMQAIAGVIVAGSLALFFSVWMGRSVIAGVQTLVDATEKLAAGAPLQTKQTGIDEIDFVSKALASTAEALSAREAALAHARDEAVAASRAKDEFLASLSHELRTPLNPVLLLSSDAAKDPSHPPATREMFGTIARNVSIEARLIDDLLDLTRISSGKLSLQLKTLHIDQLLHDTIETLRPLVEEKPLTLTLDLRSPGATTTGDATRLQQVFWNILNNALKFTPAGGRIEIASRIDGAAGRINVTISDTGLGMTPTETSRLFTRFVQGDHATGTGHSEYGGLGLGLVIARNLVEMHQGEITAQSEGRGKGSTFTVRLPLTLSSPARNSARPIASSGSNGPASLHPHPKVSGKKILLVEDHRPTLLTLEKLLQRRGHQVTSAAATGMALQHASAEAFDLVISDIGLPDRTGYELMQELHAQYGLKGIAMSGYGSDADRAQGKAAGFLIHLTKPVDIAALDEAIRRIFDESHRS
ncbi:MAG: ATP-binding protein [Nibricoccus sp.]